MLDFADHKRSWSHSKHLNQNVDLPNVSIRLNSSSESTLNSVLNSRAIISKLVYVGETRRKVEHRIFKLYTPTTVMNDNAHRIFNGTDVFRPNLML